MMNGLAAMANIACKMGNCYGTFWSPVILNPLRLWLNVHTLRLGMSRIECAARKKMCLLQIFKKNFLNNCPKMPTKNGLTVRSDF